MSRSDVKILSLNVCGLRCAKKRRVMFTHLKDSDADIICIQETHAGINDEKVWSAEWGSGIFFSHGETNARGVAILFKRYRTATIHSAVNDNNGRYIIFDIAIDECRFTLVNLYAPNVDNPTFFVDIFNKIQDIPNVEIMLIGDFNLALDSKLDRTSCTVRNKNATEILLSYMQRFELCDIWRTHNPNQTAYSWSRGINCASRIDYVLCNGSLINKFRSMTYECAFGSDHTAIHLNMQFSGNPRKENTSRNFQVQSTVDGTRGKKQ